MPLDRSVLAPEDTGTSNSNLDDLIKAEGAEHLKPVITALYAQESGSGKNSKTSVDGARGPMQIMPATFKQLARDGESIDNEADNLRVGIRLVKALGDRFNNDPARIAAGYFSGEGNVNPTGDQIIRKDKADGNGKKVSAYVQDVLNRIVPSAQAEENGTAVARSIAKGGSDNGLDIARQIAAGGGGSDGLAVAREIAGTQAAAAPAAAPADKPSTSLLDDVKKAVGWREGEKFKRPEGVTEDTFSAGVPDAQKAPTSVMDGYKTDTAAPSRNVVGMTAAGEAKLRGQLQGATDEKLAKYVDQGGLTGQVAARLLEERGVYRDKVQAGQVPTQAEDMQAGVDPKRMNQERRQDANREYLQRNKGAVMDYLTKAQRLAPEDAELAYKDMLAKGVVPNQTGMDNTRQEAGYGDVLATGAKRAVAGMGRGYMGLGEWLGDAFGVKDLSKFSAAAASGYEADFKAAADDVVGKIPQQGFKALVAETAPSIISQLPGVMGAGIAMAFTKNPAVMESLLSTALLTPMGAQVFGETYRDGKAAGLSLTDNTIYSAGKAMAEVLPERLSLGALFKVMGGATEGSARQLAAAILGQQATEHATEQVTTVSQFLLDKAYTQPNLSLKDLQQQMIDTFKATALQAPILAAVGTGAAVTGKGASVLRDKMDPTGAMARQLDRDVSGAEFNQDDIDRAVRLQMDPNADGNTEVLPEAKGFAPTPAPSATAQPEAAGQQPVAVAPNEDPLGDAPLTSPIADELASLEGTPAEEPKVGGTPVSQHTPESLQFLMNTHPDQVVRNQAAQVLQQKQAAEATYPVVTQTENGPVESRIDSALKGQINDSTVHALAQAASPGGFTLTSTAGGWSFHGPGSGMGVSAEDFGRLLGEISGRSLVGVEGVDFRGAIADQRHVFLNREQGAEGLTAVAFHELRHALVEDHPDLSAFWSEAVQQHMDTSDKALLSFLVHNYSDKNISPARIAAMRAKGRTDSQILNALLATHPSATAYEADGRGSKRDWVVEELEADALGDAANRDGVIHKALDYMAKVDIGLVKQFAQFVQGVLKRIGKGFNSSGLVKGSTEAEIRARLEALDKAAAEVLGKYASRTQNQKRMQSATPAELLLIKKSHPDAVVRDMAEAELKKRETEAAYNQREEQKAGEKENFKQANAQARLDQAEAEAKAAGTDDGTPTAMAQAMAGMKKDIQSLRRQLAKEMKRAAATARGSAQVRQSMLEDNEAGRFSPKREAADQTLPTRWPTSKRMTPSVNDPMLADLATLRETPKQFEQAVNALAEEPGMRTRARSTEGKLDAILDKMTSNLLWLYDMVPAEIRERSKLWYDGANTIASNWAKTYGKTRSQTAGILAVLSPQKDWFMNVTMAERVLDILSSQMDHPFDAKMRGAAFKFLVKDFAKAEDKRDNLKAFDAVKGKTLKEAVEAGDLRQAGIWLRAYDEAYHDPRHAVIHPEGDFGDNARTVTGTETLRAWGDFNALGKAASIFLDGSAENINAQLGGEHKVRNFYNNIYAPKDERFATIDTHAVAADLLRPLAGADKPVADNFGASGGSDLTGVSGTYPIHLEAYRRAAEARGVLPREMQSITWEAVRGLFTEGFKGKKDNLKAIDNVWREVDKGKLTTAEARAKILDMAGGMEHPDWWNGQEPQSEGKAKSYSQKRPAFTGNKIVFEVAPDPHDTQLTQRWNALPEDLKGRISYDIAWDTAGKLLGYYNSDTIKGELHPQMGGYLEDTNPSFSLWMNKYASMVKVQEIANTLGYVLRQDSMVIGSPKSFKGGTEMGVVVIQGVSDTNAKKVYDELRTAIRAEDGSALINGHTTAEGSMAILVELGSEEAIHHRVVAQLGDRHDVGYATTFVQWPQRGENEYGFTGQDQTGRGVPESPLREYAHQLRAEAAAELERRIAGRFSPAREGRGSAAGLPPEFGQARPGAVAVRGVHYSGQSRDRLSSAFYGTGLKGAEASRLADPANADLRQRLYFYVDEGKGVFPEQGVGSRSHDVQLNNLYDLKADPLRLRRDNSGDPSAMERAIMKAGFDGYYAPEIFTRQGAVVLIGNHSVPVRQLNQDEAPRFSPSRRFYSQLQRSFEQAPDRVFGPAAQVKAWLAGNAAKRGIKQDEIQWTGINEWLDLQGKNRVSKADVLDYLAANGVQVEEVEKGKAGYDENNPQLPADLTVERSSSVQFKYQVVNDEGDVLGRGDTEADAISDTYSAYPEFFDDEDTTKYGQYVLPGGENYRELLLKLPGGSESIAKQIQQAKDYIRQQGKDPDEEYGYSHEGDYIDLAEAMGWQKPKLNVFRSNHWEEPNILAHVRFNDRTDAEGNRVLFIEELQSDWGQEGKKKGFAPTKLESPLSDQEYSRALELQNKNELSDQEQTELDSLLSRHARSIPKGGMTPSAPFVTKTEAWLDLGLKRMIAYAVENGYDKVAFVNGQQSAERYDLSKQVDVIYAGMAADGKYLIGADKGRERDVINKKVTKEELPDLVGKELAEKIINDVTDEDTNAEYRGLDLQVGGSGMKAFYDQIVPQRVREVLKKLGGGAVETIDVPRPYALGEQYIGGKKERIQTKPLSSPQPGFTITPAMREKVGQGMPLFSWARRFSDEEGKAATALMTYLAEDKAMFQVPISQAETLPEIVKEIDPAANIKDVSKWFDDGRTVWRLTLPKVGNRAADAYITERDGKVWINAASLEEGSDGNRIYAMVGNYAYNTGKVFIGDPEGITTAGMRRRAENMMSLALKFGTTDFIEPHEKMLKLLGMTWEKGNDQKNLQSLLNTTYNTNVSLTNGEIADVTFNFDDGKFYKNGSVFDDAAFARLAAGVRGTEGLDSAGAPGPRSLRVAALVNTVLSRADSAERGTLLESVRAFRSKEVRLADSNNGGVEGPLHSLRYSRIRDAIDNTLAAVDHAVDGLSNLPNQFDYLKDRYLALGKIARVDEIIKEIRGAFDHVPQADKQAVYAYLTTRGASPTMIGNNEARAMAQRIKQTINYVGDALVQRGLLDPAARAHYRDQYLPRLYLKHLMSEQDWKVIGAGKKPTDMGYLKHRKDIAPEVRELILGEVKDPAFLSANAIGRAMRDVSLLDWMAKISQNNDWVFPDVFVDYRGKRVTAYWLKAEADRIERQIPHYEPGAQTRAKQLVDGMRQAANQALGNMSSVDHTKYKQIPDTHRYGLLRGMYVRTEIFNDIMGASQIVNADPTWFEDWFGFGGKGTKLTQWWKFSKVALNPPGQVRNFLSNMVMLQLSGVGLHKLPMRLIQAVNEVANNGPHWKVAKKYGVTESTFTAQELFRVKRDLLAIEASAGSMNPLTWLRVASAKLLEGVSNMYQFSEALGKTIKIIDEMENGKSEAEAAIEAQKWLFDYSLVPQSIRVARNSPVGMPFITYQIKALPRLLEVAVKHPWRFLPWIGLFYGMQAYVASLFGVDEDELKKLKKSLPEWLQDRAHSVFMPVRDADGRLQVADVGYFFPWTFFSQTGTHLAEGNLKKAFVDDIGGQFSAPILGSAAALMANYDTFTHKPIYQESDPVQYKAAAIANYAYDLMAPPFLSSHGFMSPMGLADKQYGGKMVQAVTGTTNKFGDPKATEAQALAGLFGFNFYGMDPEHTRATNMQVMAKKVQDAELQLKYRLMDRGLSEEQRAKYIAAYKERMVELADDVKKYAAESEVPDQLRVKK